MKGLGRILWSFGEGDQVAAALSGLLANSPLLSDREQTLYGDTIQAQEREHAKMFKDYARAEGSDGVGFPTFAGMLKRDCIMLTHLRDPRLQAAWTLSGLQMNEEQAISGFVAWERIMREQGRTQLADDLALVIRDERMHLDSSKATIRRIGENDPAFREMARRAYQLTRAAYMPVLAHKARVTYRALEK